jgi:hypothetical protein
MGTVPYGPVVEQDDAVVTYGVKELLADINNTLIRVDTKLDGKADKAAVDHLEGRVTNVERAHIALKNRAIGAAAVASLLGGAVAARITDLF